jgi:hypothetical protein
MANIYKGQGNITISLDTGISLAGASSPVILYQKPTGAKGQWVGAISGTLITYNVGATDIDQAGSWFLQAQVTIAGSISLGQVAEMVVTLPIK